MSPSSLQQIVQQRARAAGFHLSGVAPADLQAALATDPKRVQDAQPGSSSELEFLEAWIAEGRAGEMEYLKRRDPDGKLLRSSVQVPFPWVRSVIVCGVNYNSDQKYSIDANESAESRGWIARYAWSGQRADATGNETGEISSRELSPTDYHSVIRGRLSV